MLKHEDNAVAPLNGSSLQPLAGITVTVTDKATGLPASLYADDGVTPLAQPLITGNTGYYGFKAPDGTYVLTFSGPRIETFTREITLDDPKDNPYVTVAALAAGNGAQGVGYNGRTLADKLGESVSVKDAPFNAKGDGITDDTTAIQAAIDAVSAAGGGRLLIPAGTFIVSARTVSGIATGVAGIVMKDGVTLQLDGAIKVKASSYGPGAFYAAIRSLDSGLSNAAIVGTGTVDGNKANQTASQQCSNIYLICKSNICVDGVNLVNANGMGVQFVPVTGSTYTACSITNCYISDCSNIGLQVSHGVQQVITGNRIRNCANNGIDIYGDNGTTTPDAGVSIVAGNVVDNVLVGVFVETTSRISVTGNAINGSGIGVCVNRINGAPSLVTISGNTTSACGKGIQVTGDTNGVLINGNSLGFSSVGLQLGSGGNVSYVSAMNNFFVPSSTTADLVNVAGNTASFIVLRNNMYKDSAHDQTHLIVVTATSKVGCSLEPIALMSQGGQPLKKIYNGSSASGGTATITIPDVGAGRLVIKATAGGAWDSVWTGSIVASASRVSVAQEVTTFTTPGNAISSVAGSTTTRDITVTWAATGSTVVWVAYLEYF